MVTQYVTYVMSSLAAMVKANIPDSNVHGANVGPTWGRQDPGGPHVGHRNLAIWDSAPFINKPRTMVNMMMMLMMMMMMMMIMMMM